MSDLPKFMPTHQANKKKAGTANKYSAPPMSVPIISKSIINFNKFTYQVKE